MGGPTGMKSMMAIRLPAEIDDRLTALAKRTGRTKTYYAREAILRFIDDMEDTYIAIERLEKPVKRLTMAEAEKELGMDD
jgi:RHH-type rel operon transcriptional repressor/antitoxin RelB